MKSEHKRLLHEQANMNQQIRDNREKVKLNKQLPYLVSNVVEVGYHHDYCDYNASQYNNNKLLLDSRCGSSR
jgi:ATP-dependent 26S proteasome regulatory subunit